MQLIIAGVRLCGGSIAGPVDIEIADGRIAAVTPAGAERHDAEVIDGSSRLAVPGFINGHQHSHELFFRGRSEKLPLEAWMTSVRPTKPLPLTPEDVYWRTLAVAAEALRTGTTTICDDVGIDPADQSDLLAAAVKAYEDAGVRAYVGPTLFDVPFVKAVPFVEQEVSPEILASQVAASSERTLDAFCCFAERIRGRRVQAIAAPSAPQRCSATFLTAVRAVADRLDIPLMTHVLETRVQAVGAELAWGCSMIEYMDRLGVLKPKTSLIHGIWLTRNDIAIIARTGASVQHNPWSNLKLGSGLAAMRALIDAGVNVSLGSDGCGSIETVNLAPSIASMALLSTLRGAPEQWLSAEEALQAATLGGARALGIDGEIGRIAPGYRADLVLYRLDRPPFLPLNDPVRQFVYGAATAAVSEVIVDGKLVMREGVLTMIDESALHRSLDASHARLLPHLEAAERQAGELKVAMLAIRRRCSAHELRGVHVAHVLESES